MMPQQRWLVYLYLAAICALGIAPLIPPSRWLFMDDGFLHLFRVTELDWLIHSGQAYPRWATHFAYGYGYPVFNFYPPLVYYLTLALHHLAGLEIPIALQCVLALIVIVAALGAYVLGRAWFDSPLAGLLVSTAYVFFPYFILDVYLRGALAEALAAAILPWLLWSLQRVIHRQAWDSVILAAFTFAAFTLAHNITVLLSMPLLMGYVAWQLAYASERLRALMRVSIAALGGAALAALYWLPTLGEMSLVAVSRSNRALTALLDASFLTPSQLVQLAFPYQYTEQPYALSVTSVCLAVLALFLARRQPIVWFFGALGLCSTILLLDVTQTWWHTIPLLKTAQFAWRVSVFIGLGLAVLTGALALAVRHNVWRILLAILVSVILVWNGLGNLTIQHLDYPESELTLAQMARFEINTRGLGFGSFAEYLPLTVQSLATKLDMPPSATSPDVTLQALDTQTIRLRVSTPHQVTLIWRTFYFPGWYAKLDDEPLDLFPSTPLGLVSFVVPPGAHHITIWFGDTLPRQIGTGISAITLIALLGVTLFFAYKRTASRPLFVWNAIALVLVLSPQSVAWTAHKPPVQPTSIEVTPELRLIGLQVSNATHSGTVWRVSAGQDTLPLQVVWFARAQWSEQPFTWRLVDADGRIWVQRTQWSRFGTGFPSAWVANEIVQDHFELPLKAGMSPGMYNLQVGVGSTPHFVSATLVELSQVTIPSEPSIMYRYDARFGDSIRLVGANIPSRVQAGNPLPVTLFWRAEQDIPEDFTVFIHLLDQQEKLLAQHDGMSQANLLPTMLWHPGRIVADKHTLNIPRDAMPGIYRLRTGLYRFQSLERLLVNETDDSATIGEIKIPLPSPSKPRTILNVSLGARIRLEGFDAPTHVLQNQPYTLTLYWQAITAPSSDWHVFVHILDANNQIVAQQDSPPRHGTYPTRSWDTGERVDDTYSFVLTIPGQYRVIAGMYDPLTGERLPVRDIQGNDLPDRHIFITTFEVLGK